MLHLGVHGKYSFPHRQFLQIFEGQLPITSKYAGPKYFANNYSQTLFVVRPRSVLGIPSPVNSVCVVFFTSDMDGLMTGLMLDELMDQWGGLTDGFMDALMTSGL